MVSLKSGSPSDSQPSSRDSNNPSADILSVKNAGKTMRKSENGPAVMLDDSFDRVIKDDSGDMPTSVPNFLVKTYEIVNVSV